LAVGLLVQKLLQNLAPRSSTVGVGAASTVEVGDVSAVRMLKHVQWVGVSSILCDQFHDLFQQVYVSPIAEYARLPQHTYSTRLM